MTHESCSNAQHSLPHPRITGAKVPAEAREQGLLLLSNMARIDERFYGPLGSADICGHVRSLSRQSILTPCKPQVAQAVWHGVS